MNNLQIIECNSISRMTKQEMIRWSFLEMIDHAGHLKSIRVRDGQIALGNFLLCVHREKFGDMIDDNPVF